MLAPLLEVSNLRFRCDDGTQAPRVIALRPHPGEAVAQLDANGRGT
jgi:hypothetical protein